MTSAISSAMRATITDPLSRDMLNFETQIAYFFAVPNPEEVAKHYIEAVKAIEEFGQDQEKLHSIVMPHLRLAYQEVKNQMDLNFDTETAASLEFDLFLSGIQNSSFEDDYQILVKIYETVFQIKSAGFIKAAMLRAFLYKYKMVVFSETKKLTPSDQEILLEIANASEECMRNYIRA